MSHFIIHVDGCCSKAMSRFGSMSSYRSYSSSISTGRRAWQPFESFTSFWKWTPSLSGNVLVSSTDLNEDDDDVETRPTPPEPHEPALGENNYSLLPGEGNEVLAKV